MPRVLILMLLSLPAAAQEIALPVDLVGVDAARGGTLRCAAFATAEGWPTEDGRAVARAQTTPDAPVCTLTLPGPGTYAVSVLHDEDGDATLAKNFLGIPKEGWASSRDVVPALRAPRFDESAVAITASTGRLAVTLHY